MTRTLYILCLLAWSLSGQQVSQPPGTGGGGGSSAPTNTAVNPAGNTCTTVGLYIYTVPTPKELWVCPANGDTYQYIMSGDLVGTGMLTLTEGTVPSNPAASKQGIWINTADGLPYLLNSSGVSKMFDMHSINGSWGSLRNTVALTADVTEAACDTAPATGTIYGWSARIKPSGASATFLVWKNASATTDPTVADKINTAGIGISANTRVASTTLSDFTTLAVTAGDNVCVNLSAVSGSPTYASFKALYR